MGKDTRCHGKATARESIHLSLEGFPQATYMLWPDN